MVERNLATEPSITGAMSNEQICMKWWRLVLCGALLAAGCSTVANPISCADGFCHDPALPFCDVDGTIGGGQRLTCIAVSCTPLEFEACRGDEAIVCNATGDDYDVTHCEGGCSAEAGGCKATHVIPKYLPAVCDQLATEPELTISESMTLDTSIDANCNGGIIAQNTGPEICVIHHGRIALQTNQTLTVIGSRAIALVADQELMINGTLDVSANGYLDGPGGGVILQFNPNSVAPAGRGGFGFRTSGGSGGTETETGGANNGGPASMDPALMIDLVGAPGVGHSPIWNLGAGAGGAATVISCRNTVSVPGMIDAGGGGGLGGASSLWGASPALGGGAGGNVVLQGMMVEVTGQVFANGGGGGAGCPSTSGYDGVAASGADGARSDRVPAQGGATSARGEGAGGAGGIGTSLPGPGSKPITQFRCAGAGGGSTGFLQIYTPAGVTPRLMPAAVSPPFQPNRTIPTR